VLKLQKLIFLPLGEIPHGYPYPSGNHFVLNNHWSDCPQTFTLDAHRYSPDGINFVECLSWGCKSWLFGPEVKSELTNFLTDLVQHWTFFKISPEQLVLYTIRVGAVRYSPHSKEPSSFDHHSSTCVSSRCMFVDFRVRSVFVKERHQLVAR